MLALQKNSTTYLSEVSSLENISTIFQFISNSHSIHLKGEDTHTAVDNPLAFLLHVTMVTSH